MTETNHGQPTAAALWRQQTAGLRRGAVRVRRRLGRLRRALKGSGEESPVVALYEETRSQLEHVGADAARLRTEVDTLAEHLRLLTRDVARSEWEQATAETWVLGNPYLDEPSTMKPEDGPPFPAYSTPVASDFSQSRFYEMCRLLGLPPKYHRKLWEWAFILHELIEAGVVTEGSRGLGFGVGTEALPAVFAASGVTIVATDAPVAGTWVAGNQHSGSIDQLLHPEVAPDAVVRRQVTHQACDMNDIDPTLTGFDFNWSSCSFEHLGSIEQGLDFVVNAIEMTLKPGGVGVHTTELNAQSAEDTVTEGGTVLFRMSDLLRLADRLTALGHHVQPIVVGPQSNAIDLHVDTAPYTPIHLRLKVAGFTTTSVGLVVRRGE
jgi:hypothetical protein